MSPAKKQAAQTWDGLAGGLDIRTIVQQHAVIEREKLRGKKHSAYFNASSLGYCLRRQVLQRGAVPGTDDTIDAKTLANFDWGEALHTFTRKRIKRFGLMIKEEVYLRDEEYGLSGYIDAVWGGDIQSLPEDLREKFSERYVGFLDGLKEYVRDAFGMSFPVVGTEIKSAASYAMERAFTEGPQFQHMMQLAAYKVMAERNKDQLREQDVPLPTEWTLLMVGKDTTGILEFALADYPSLLTAARSRIDRLAAFWADPSSIPPCTCGQTRGMAWEKRFCKYIEPEDLWKRDSRKKEDKESIRCCDEELLAFVDRTPPEPQEVKR